MTLDVLVVSFCSLLLSHATKAQAALQPSVTRGINLEFFEFFIIMAVLGIAIWWLKK